MRERSKSNTSLFLLEMLMVCGFLLYCSSIFVKAFVKSDEISRYTQLHNNCILYAQSLAEEWKAGQINIGSNETLYYILDDGFSVIDASVEPIETKNVECRVFCSELEESSYIKELNITMSKEDEVLYTLTVSRFGGGSEYEEE